MRKPLLCDQVGYGLRREPKRNTLGVTGWRVGDTRCMWRTCLWVHPTSIPSRSPGAASPPAPLAHIDSLPWYFHRGHVGRPSVRVIPEHTLQTCKHTENTIHCRSVTQCRERSLVTVHSMGRVSPPDSPSDTAHSVYPGPSCTRDGYSPISSLTVTSHPRRFPSSI